MYPSSFKGHFNGFFLESSTPGTPKDGEEVSFHYWEKPLASMKVG
jgi:hypothetical protein